MPCQSDWPDENITANNLRRELDNITRLLCGLCGNSTEATISKVENLPEWWEEHQRADRLRHEREEKVRLEQVNRDRKQLQQLADKLGVKIVD